VEGQKSSVEGQKSSVEGQKSSEETVNATPWDETGTLAKSITEQAIGMTREEFINASVERIKKTREAKGEKPFSERSYLGSEKAFRQQAGIAHREHIEKALAEGETVPPEVLADYPDLTPKAPAASIDDEIQNASMEDIDALIDAVIAEQEGTRQSGKDAVPIAELTPERQAASAIKDMQDNPPTAWVVSNDQVTSSEQEIEEVSKLLGRALNGNEKYTITHRSDRNFDLSISIDNEDGMGHDFLDLVRVSPAFAKIIRDMAADALVVRFGIIRTEPEKIVPVKEITDTKKKYAALDAFTSKDESRLSFQGFLNDEGTLVATNGHIMAVVPRAGKDLEVGKIYRMKKGGGLEVIRDQFPDYKRAIPELADVNNFATLSREQAEYLLSLLGATEERNRVNRSDVKGEFVSLMLFTVNLPDFSLVNGEYLATCLRLGLSMGADEVSFYRKPGVNRLRHPVLMVASKGGDAVAKMVIMPLREETAGLDISLSDIATRKKEASAPSKTMSPTSPKVAAPSRSLDSILADATKEGFGGAAEAIKGLYELFGGGSLKSFPGGFDADTYTKAKPHFEAAMEHMRNAGKGLKEFVSFFVERLGATVKPYLVRYLQDLKGVEPAAEASATSGAENSTSDAETKKEDAEDAINLDENTGKGEKGSRKRLTAEEKAEREAKKQAAKEKKEKKAALGNFQNVGYVYDPEKINRKIKDKPPKSAAKILLDEMAPAKVWNIQFAEDATPGTTRMLDQVQKYFVSFKDFLTNDYNKIKRYAFKRKAEDAVNDWLEEGPGNIDQLKAWAEEYGKALQPVIDAFQGQSGIMRTIHRLQTELLGDVRRKADGTFPEYYEAKSSLSHPSFDRDLYTANGMNVRYFYSFLAEDYQKLLDAENDILLSEIDINKRTRNQTVVRIGLPDYRESVDLQKTEDFQEPFGFNGVGFGEQGWINQEERHRVVNAAYDAFKDLAATIGATEKGMSLGGGLAVQFANLGHKAKGAAAAFFPDIKTINFTRDHGDGTMAHEWGHALHYMAAPETIEEINSVIQAMKFVYDFEAGTRMVDDLLAKDSPFLKRILSSKRQQRIEAVKAEADRRFVSVVKKETDYFSTAKEMDADYTARETEMWARAFEAYIFDTMAGTNNYLVNDFVSAGRVGGRSGVGTRLVYPAGLERETFNATIKHFLEGLAWDENGLPHLKEGYETIEQLNERLLDEKLKELQDSVEERYKAIWSSEPSVDGHYWYQYDETAFGPMMQPDGYVAYDKGYKGTEQNGSGAVGYLTQLHPDAILDYKLSNIQHEGDSATYISDARGGINNALEEDGAEALEGELPGGKRKNDQAGDIRSDERGGGEGGEGRTHSPSNERDSASGAEGAGDSGILAAAAPGNYRITDLTLTDPKPVTERFNRNLAAIKVLKSIESEDRSASPGVTFIGEEPPGGWTEADKVSNKYDKLAERGNEKEILARYTGWGGMAELFAWEPGKAWAGKVELLKAELDRNEIRGAESSSTSSYYTPVPVAQFMWKLAQRLGFERGVVLDPATGASGLFFGTMPGELQQNVALQGVEMDGISARVASKLYELAAIDNKPFQEVKKPNNRYDLTITNVPFEGITPSDPKHNKGQYLLHNYFINKMLDLTAPGALSMMITTSNTMDKAGAHLQEFAKKADFVGAIRLPSGIYSATNVVTDILVFRKKIEGSKFQGIPAEEWTTTGTHESTGLEVNNYFLKHPEMIAGKLEVIQGRWGDDNIRVVGEGDLQTNLERLAAAFPAKIVEREAVRELKSIDDIIAAPGTVKEGGLYINDKGEACLKVEGEEEKLPTATASEKKRAGIAKQYVKILDQVRTVLRAQKTGAEEAEIKAAQKQLKKEYDDFVKKYGPVNKPENYDVYSEATDSDWVVALEDYDLDTGKVVKLADIFTKDITISGQTPTRADTDHDALAMSLNEFGYPNLEYMAKLRGSDVETVMKGVSDKIVEDPETGFLVTMDEYLSGNVKRKLLVAREMAESNPEYERNVKLLEAAQPDEIPAHRITARIGASWIDPQHLSDYVTEKLDMDGILTPVFSFNPITNEWALSFKGRPRYKGKNWGEESKAETERQIQRFRSSVEATRLWGTNRRDFIALIQDAIAGKRPEVHYTGADGKRYLDEVATQAAENKLQEIQSDFGRWLFDEPGRAEAAVNRFNDLINTSIPPKADGSHLTFPGKSLAVLTQKEKEDLGMTDAIAFYPHQSNAVWKYLRGGNIYLAHEVGAGKTMTMALLAMEAKRLRGKKKVLYVTLNDSTMGQAVAEIKKLYPLANVLQVRVSTQEQRKRRALQKLAMNDFDIAIMRQQDLDRIALSPESETVFIEEELQEYREVLEEAKRSGSRIQEQQIQQAIHALEEKLKAPGAHDEAKRKNLFFDDLGIDLMIVDEAHRYKNVPYATRLNRITGLNPAGSPTAKAFFRKTQYMNAQYPRQDGVVLASGTALSNSIAEFYNIQRMLQPKEVKRQGVWSFDRWIANYGDMGSQLEWDGARGRYKNITTNRKIVNAGRLLATAYQNIDCVRAEDTPIRRPKIRGGEPQRIKIQPNQYVEDYRQIVLQRCAEIEQNPKEAMFEGVPDNMLRVISNMSKIAIDQRLDPRYKNTELQEDSKIYRASRLIRQRWEEEAEHKGVQVVFADIGIPKRYLNFKYKTDEELEKLTDEQREEYAVKKVQYEASANQFSTYDGLKDELIKLGIPAEQIAFIHDADDTNKDKKAAKLRKLFKKVNEGEIRVLIGSTDKAGTGVNIQKRISDVHHLDVWWNYSSWEQRNGRAIRAGNIYTDMEGVYIHNYVTETTVDATRWDKIFAKGKVLNATLGGDINLDVIEDISEETMSAKMMAAEASGNPLMAKQATLLQQVQGLRFEQSSFLDNVRRARMDLAATPDRIAAQEKYIEDYKASRATMEKVTAVRFAGDNRTLILEKHGKEIAETLKKAIEKDLTAWDPGKTAPLLVFGTYTATEKTIEEKGKSKKVKEYSFIPLTAKAEMTCVDGDPFARGLLMSGGIMNAERTLAEIKGKGKNATVDVKANISRTVTEYLTRLDSLEKRANDSIKELREDEPKFRKIAETPWSKADELAEKAKELAEVEREMAAQGQPAGNPETGVSINLFKGTVPILEDVAAKSDWNITKEGVVYPDGYDPAIAIRKQEDLNKFSETKTRFKPSFAGWNSPDQVSAVLVNATKPETPAMKPVAYTTVDDATRFWMNDKFKIHGNEVALTVDEGAWRFLERVVGTAGTWHPEEFMGSVFLVHVGIDGQRDAMIAARAERGEVPAGVAELMKSPEAPQYNRSVDQARGMASRRVQSIVDKATSFLKGAPKVHVVQHVSECPIDVLKDMEKNGILDESGDADVQGFSWNGQVWLVSDNINSAEEAAFILMHELAHDGLGTFLRRNSGTSGLKSIRTNYNSLMDAIYQAHKKEVREIARTTHRHLDLSTISGCRQAAEEWLCNQAYEAQPKWYDRLVAIFNDLLRAIGMDAKLSEAEVRIVLRDAFKSFGEGEGAARYMVAAWHGSRNIFDRFDLGKASTGAYGYGLYFSSMKEIGELYQEGGSLYQVMLTPDESDFMDWNQPLYKQSEEVKKALDNPEVIRAINAYEDTGDYVDTGKDLYIALMMDQGGGAEASRFLNSIGIPGIKYYEMAVSDKGKSGYNFVLFDDGQVNIEARYPYQEKMAEAKYSRKGKVYDWEDVSKKIKRLSLSETSSYLASPGVDKAPSDRNTGRTIPLSSDLVKKEPKYSRRSEKVSTTSLFPEVEERIREAKGIKHAPLKDKAKDLLALGWQEMTRHFPHLDPKTQGKTIEVLRQFQEVPVWAKQKATGKLDEFIGKLGPDDRHVFGMNLILADMLRDLDSGLLEPHPEDGLPFGYKDRNQVSQDLDHFAAIAENRPEIQKALQKRNDYMSAINDRMIALKILPKDLANDPAAYFHHQVLAYLNYQSENKGLGVSAKEVKKRRKGWQFSRTGSVKDYNTEYVEAEFEVLSQALAQIATVETINKIDKLENVKRSLEDKAKRENMRAFRSHFDPTEDPLKPYKTKMAMSFAKLEKLTKDGGIFYPPEFGDLEDHIREMATMKKEDKRDLYQPHPKMFAFLSYLVNHGGPGAVPAATILKAIGERNKFIRDTVGEKNWITFRDLIPDGYVSYKPDAHPAFYFANSIQDQVLEQVLSGNRTLQDRDVKAVLAKARDAEWIVPEGVALTLKEFRPAAENSLVGKLSADSLSLWKQWVLINPFRVFRYNLNNMSGDLDIAMAYDPKIITGYMMQAFRDLRAARKGLEPGELKEEIDKAMRKGVVGSGITQWEIPELSDVQSVKGLVDFFDGKTGNAVTRAWNFSKSVTTLRENILRLAAYRYFKDRLAEGGKGIYAASNKEEIDQIADMDDRAAKLSRELIGDYGNISHAGQYIRKRLIPFYAWLEINAPRYVRLLRNVQHEGGSYKSVPSVIAWKAAKLGLKAMALMGMVMLWNATFFPDEEDELQETGRDQLHLILGRREDGSIRTIRFQGALSDALSWFGLDNPLETAKLYAAGRKSAGDLAKDAVKAAPVKLFQGLRPEPKLLYEVASGQSFYPDPTRTRPIHDTMEHILRTFSLDKPYNMIAGKPRPEGSLYEQLKKDISGMLVHYSDPGEQAYYSARKYVFDWLEKSGREKPPAMPTNRSNALYYYRQALKFGDFEAAEKYLKKYKELGGKERTGIRMSIRNAAPLAGLRLSDRYRFRQSLSPEQQETLRRAMDWYKEHYVEARREDVARRMGGGAIN
jgi:N12 class adenine-specific DNA methylase